MWSSMTRSSSPAVDRALADNPGVRRVVAWTDDPANHETTVEKLITTHTGRRPKRAGRRGKLILLTAGTTGTPKGAKRSGGGPKELKAVLDRTPWRAEETTVVVAPMFHAWGFSQLILSAMMACTVVTRRKFDPEATLQLVDRYRATGLSVVPVMFDRIMDLPDDVRKKYSCRALRFAAASGSRMRPDVVSRFMDEFGPVIYNNYNATEAGMIATATPETCVPPRTPPARPPRAPRSGSSTANSRSCPQVRSAVSMCGAPRSSTATPRARPRSSTRGSCRLATSATSTTPAGFRGRSRRRDDRVRRRKRVSDRGGDRRWRRTPRWPRRR